MANYTTNLKTWGSSGSEYPDGYNYAEGEQPVDAWDNFLTHHVIADIDHLVSLTNGRIESGVASSYPSSPEDGELVYRTDNESLEVRDDTNSTWHRLFQADGDSLSGNLDANGQQVTDTTGALDLRGKVDVDQALLRHEWASKFEGGTVQSGDSVSLRAFELANSETLNVTQAHLTADGFTSAAVSGIELSIVPEGAVDGNDTTTILTGDGSTVYADERGNPLASYTNSSGSSQIVMVAIDNGQYASGAGTNEQTFGGCIARVV